MGSLILFFLGSGEIILFLVLLGFFTIFWIVVKITKAIYTIIEDYRLEKEDRKAKKDGLPW
ncbi:hypothetical protein [Streptococcus sciuri]|uniref:Uncharacterized protein n=1 Tax=Streptococcus sciuri TaxID=2973939 RepID=A0ABT2F5B1_9STRE|nr:hypothetical protein [Streptococcus sciuri]MCS4487666.1 hypothetical protein [Streptococcus sciuri]